MATGAAGPAEGGAPFAATWNGTKWSLASTGLASSSDLSCTASNACTVVGAKESKTLIQRWGGSEWSAQTSPNPEGKTPTLNAVSCASASVCTTVGKGSFGSGESVTLGERYE